MKKQHLPFVTYALIVVVLACQCKSDPSKLVLKRDRTTSLFAYFDEKGSKVLGDYYAAYTDTIIDFGIVADPDFVLIDKKGTIFIRYIHLTTDLIIQVKESIE